MRNRTKNQNQNKTAADKARFNSILTKEFLEQKFVQECLSYKQISEIVGCGHCTVGRRIREFGLNKKNHRRDNIFPDKRFGILTVIKKTGETKNNNIVWECLCDCGKTAFILGGNLKDREKVGTKSCGCLKDKSGKESRSWRGHGELSGRYWSIIENNAKSRNLELAITIEYAWELFLAQNQKCSLTGWNIRFYERGNGNDYSSQTASLDRKDSAKGYVEGNVQWVHKDVNIMKMDYSQDYFIEACRSIAKNWPETT